ncbi:MAG: ERF family protein [Nocardioides sp.]
MSESTEVATRSATHAAVAKTNPLGEIGALLDGMMAMAKDPNVDAAKFETIARVVRETREDARKEQFYTDKANALLDMPVIDKRGKITIAKAGEPVRVQGTFALWPDLQRAIYPVLAVHNLALTHDVGHEGVTTTVTPVLQHRNGYVERGEPMALPLDTSGGKNNTQGAGSAASYGKRHTSIAMLGIRMEDSDDDGWLTATADEPLNDQQARRVEEAKARWADGPEVYETWFGKLQPKDKAWMIQTGRHAEITGKDAGRLIAGASPGREAVEGKPEPRPEPKGHDVKTPDGWTAQYEDDCRSAATLDDLARVQSKGANAMKKLKDKGQDDLHDRAIKAGSEAYARLSPDDQEGEQG